MIQTRQRLKCHRTAQAGAELITFGRVVSRYEKRGREYVDIEVAVITADAPDSTAVDLVGDVHSHRDARCRVMERHAYAAR